MGFLHRLFTPLVLLLALSCQMMPTPAGAQTRDVAGAKDFPAIGRFGGSVITGYQVKDFDAARMQAAPFKDGQPAGGWKAASPASPIAPIPAPRSSKSPATSRLN
jgi:hypothetical protein